MSGKPKSCSECGAGFVCDAQGKTTRCWCDGLPPVAPTSDGADCLCPACLGQMVQEQSRARNAASPASLIEGEDYYYEGAAFVFTARYHLRRGFCCQNGCRHCPYRNATASS